MALRAAGDDVSVPDAGKRSIQMLLAKYGGGVEELQDAFTSWNVAIMSDVGI